MPLFRKPTITEQTISHPAFGEVTVRRTPRAKRVSISVRPPAGAVRLTVPTRGSVRDAMRFLNDKSDWIAAAQQRVRQRRNNIDGGEGGNPAAPDRKAQIELWRRAAQRELPPRLEALAREHGFRHGKVTVRNTVSKWGSCSARGDISLSLHLMRLPEHLRDYVILHELCHTRHHNHGAGFHALLTAVTRGLHPTLRKELRTYNPR